MCLRRAHAWAAAVLLCGTASAQTQSDLALDLVVDPALALYPPGATATLRFTVANEGPEDAPGAAVGLGAVLIDGANAQVTILPASAASACEYSVGHIGSAPGFHGAVFPQLQVPAIPAGDFVACELTLTVLATARGEYQLEAVVARSAAHDMVDPDESNNRVGGVFPISVPGAPLPETDLSIEAVLVGAPSVLPPGSNTEFLLTVTNAGPDLAPGSTLDLDVGTEGGAYTAGVISTSPGPGEAFCKLVRDPVAPGPLPLASALQFPQLNAGASVTCRFRLLVLDGAAGRVRLAGNLLAQADFGLPTFDPVMSDNHVNIVRTTGISIAAAGARAIPMSTTSGLLVLSILVLLTAALSRRRC